MGTYLQQREVSDEWSQWHLKIVWDAYFTGFTDLSQSQDC